MKVALLTAASDTHSTRWANGLVARGLDVHLISTHPLEHTLDERVYFHRLPVNAPHGYFLSVFSLKKILKKTKPDILNAHFAFGYGLIGRLSGFKPYLLSVWGADVYDYPDYSFIHHKIVYDNLNRATAIASTSNAMAVETAKVYKHEHVFITPFGIDESLFKPENSKKKENQNKIVIGTVKKLFPKYGIDVLIKAFKKLKVSLAGHSPQLSRKLELVIAGQGPDKEKLENLAKKIGIDEVVTFTGFINHEKVPAILNTFDIYAALSRDDSESFGVAILEASACGLPVVVTDADGPKEVTVEGKTGLVVPKDSVDQAAKALEKLINDKALRDRMGRAGREHVIKNYTWDKSLDIMINSYEKTISMHE